MIEPYPLGTHVFHSTLGLGKVVHADGAMIHVYFRDHQGALPERRVCRFKSNMWKLLEPVPAQPDTVLDNLPPWNGSKFECFKTDLTIDAAKKAFLRHFPGGTDDTGFIAQECDYKRAATSRFADEFTKNAPQWIEAGDSEAIADGIERVYGRHLPANQRLNLLYQRVEEPAFFEALRSGGSATVSLASALLAYLKSHDREDLERYIESVSRLPQRAGGMSPCTWPTLTWLPFIAAPDRCMLVKPTIIQAFASASAREINYRSEPNALTYTAIMQFATEFCRTLEASEVNLSGRPLDLIDTQSFMWVVERYNLTDAQDASSQASKRESA